MKTSDSTTPLYRHLMSHRSLIAILSLLAASILCLGSTTPDRAESANGRIEPVVKTMQGWTVHVDPALLEGPHQEVGGRALSMLDNHLERIAILVRGEQLTALRKLEIWIEHQHPTLDNMQYHPSVHWLRQHQLDERLAKKVHIPVAKHLLSRSQMLKHPAVILHELAHSYHDQVLGFDDERVFRCFKQAVKQKNYERVLAHTGRTVRHYALSNHKEYFAEGTEAFLYRNDFFPFVRAEMAQHDPKLHELLLEIWGR